MRPLAPLLLAVLTAAGLCLTGCGDSLYYQTRSAPEGEDGFSATSRWFWGEDAEVYELPANPPAVSTETEDAHRDRVACRRPGQRFKGDTIGTLGDQKAGEVGTVPSREMARMAERSEAPEGPKTIPPNAIAGWQDRDERGARESLGLDPVGSLDRRPRSQPASGTGTIPANPMGTMGTDDAYCR